MESNNEPKVAVVGIGMVGTPLARWFAEHKNFVRGENLFLFDTDPNKGYSDDINQADIIFLTVPTNRQADGSANLSAIEATFQKLNGEKVVVIKSTVPPGTTELFQKKFPAHKVLFNPEFLTASQAWYDFIRPDRQIVGFTEESQGVAHHILSILPKAPFMSPWGIGTYQRTHINATEAELIKYSCNVQLARKVNFANSIAMLADKLGINYGNVRAGMSADHRIGDSHLDVNHGNYRGFGGYCLPKDLSALLDTFKKHGLDEAANLLRSDWEFNERLLQSQGLSIDTVSKNNFTAPKKT